VPEGRDEAPGCPRLLREKQPQRGRHLDLTRALGEVDRLLVVACLRRALRLFDQLASRRRVLRGHGHRLRACRR
jgi:hypothetical protein